MLPQDMQRAAAISVVNACPVSRCRTLNLKGGAFGVAARIFLPCGVIVHLCRTH